MSTSAIAPSISPDFGSASATRSQQTVLNNLITQLEKSVSGDDLTTSQTLLNAIEALSPSSAGTNTALGTFLTSVGTALSDGSASEAQSALTAYQSATASGTGSTASKSTAAEAGTIASGLVLSEVQLNLIGSLLGSEGAQASSSSSSSDGLLDILNAAYPARPSAGAGSSGGTSATTTSGASPYDALVSALQSSLTSGTGTADAALAYLGSGGNLLDTSA